MHAVCKLDFMWLARTEKMFFFGNTTIHCFCTRAEEERRQINSGICANSTRVLPFAQVVASSATSYFLHHQCIAGKPEIKICELTKEIVRRSAPRHGILSEACLTFFGFNSQIYSVNSIGGPLTVSLQQVGKKKHLNLQ